MICAVSSAHHIVAGRDSKWATIAKKMTSIIYEGKGSFRIRPKPLTTANIAATFYYFPLVVINFHSRCACERRKNPKCNHLKHIFDTSTSAAIFSLSTRSGVVGEAFYANCQSHLSQSSPSCRIILGVVWIVTLWRRTFRYSPLPLPFTRRSMWKLIRRKSILECVHIVEDKLVEWISLHSDSFGEVGSLLRCY